MDPLVSIIIPCYNYGFVLHETLNSLREQHYNNWEAIIVNDGSTDDTAQVVSTYAENDKRFRLINIVNQGVSVARNIGLENSRGQYIQFLDADDLIGPQKIALQVEQMEKHDEIDISYGLSYYFFNPDTRKLYKSEELPNPILVPNLDGKGFAVIKELLNASVTICSPLLKRKVIAAVKGFDNTMRHVEDWDFWLRCSFANFHYRFFDHPEVYVKIRIHLGSVSNNKLAMQEGEGILRDKAATRIAQSFYLSAEQKEELLQMNRSRKAKIYKYILAYISVTDIPGLRRIYKRLGAKVFLISFLKGLNEKRKFSKAG